MKILKLYVMIRDHYDLFLKWIKNASVEELTETRYNFHDRFATCLVITQNVFKDIEKMSNSELSAHLSRLGLLDDIKIDLSNFDSSMNIIRKSKNIQREIVNKAYWQTETTFRNALKEFRPNVFCELYPKPGTKFILGAIMGVLTFLIIPIALIAIIVKACSK